MDNIFNHKISYWGKLLAIFIFSAMIFAGCGADAGNQNLGGNDIVLREPTVVVSNPQSMAGDYVPAQNTNADLNVPTYITKIDGVYFIVDCYHDQVIYNDNLTDPLSDWLVMTSDINMGHTLASDGNFYLIDDTENNRVLVFEKYDDKYINTAVFNDIGKRPHYIQYDENTDAFYCWSSLTGEMYVFRENEEKKSIYLNKVLQIKELDGVYVRSFTINGNDVYFVSGDSNIIKADLDNLTVEKKYPVPDSIAGMAQLTIIDDKYLITISHDIYVNQDMATIIEADSLEDLQYGRYEDVYSEFIGGGTPYFITCFDGHYYLTEHRIPGHSIWQFDFCDGKITNPITIY